PAASRVRKLAAAHPAGFLLFDLLADEDGNDLTQLPLAERRASLERLFPRLQHQALALSPVTRDPAQAHAWLGETGTGRDGVMAKLMDRPYRSGSRDTMVKVKTQRTADCVVGGFRYLQARRE